MNPIRKVMDALTNGALDFTAGYWSAAHPEVTSRSWSNRVLAMYGPLFTGDVVNVSAGMDDDKEGGKYRRYFPGARSYSITNYQRLHSSDASMNERILDLSVPKAAPEKAYDLVFCHTVLEHVFEMDAALDNLCQMSRDVVVTVVPFLQSMHLLTGVFSDYWRFTPTAMARLFSLRGFDTLYCDWNREHPLANVYIMHVASRHPERYRGRFPEFHLPERSDDSPGSLLNHLLSDTDYNRGRRFRLAGKWLGRRFAGRPEQTPASS